MAELEIDVVSDVAKSVRRERFERVATRRVNRILDELRRLGQCGNRRSYEYSDEERKKIFAAIIDDVGKCEAKFINAEQQRFEL